MYTEFNPFSITGVSNSEVFLSEKDLEVMEFSFLVRPTLEFPDGCHVAPSEEGHDLQHKEEAQAKVQEEDKKEKSKIASVSSSELKIPSLGEFKVENDGEDGCRTPTALDQRIPLIPPCPPAPRKPKSLPSTKRKVPRHQVLLDLSNEIESLFPPAIVADLGGKVKRVRKGNCTK